MPQVGASSSLFRHASLPLYLAALAVTYASALTVPYAFSDTYMVLIRALHHDLWDTQMMMVLGGRPLLALVTSLYFPYVHSIAELRWFRLFGLLGLALFASIYAAVLRRQGAPRALIWGLPLFTACLPPFQIYIAWAVCAPYTWAAALAGLAFAVLEQDFRPAVAHGPVGHRAYGRPSSLPACRHDVLGLCRERLAYWPAATLSDVDH